MTPQPVRDLLVSLTGLIPDEEIAGYTFIASLIFTDHIFNVIHRVIG
jgi:hypothetical protein